MFFDILKLQWCLWNPWIGLILIIIVVIMKFLIYRDHETFLDKVRYSWHIIMYTAFERIIISFDQFLTFCKKFLYFIASIWPKFPILGKPIDTPDMFPILAIPSRYRCQCNDDSMTEMKPDWRESKDGFFAFLEFGHQYFLSEFQMFL